MKTLKGIAALLTLLAVLVGLPAGLVAVFGNPFAAVTSAGDLASLFTTPDYTGDILWRTVVPCVAWALWGLFLASVLTELPAQLRRVPAVRIPGRAIGMQFAAGTLIAAVIVLFTSSGWGSAATAEATTSADVKPVVVAAAAAAPAPEAAIDTQESEQIVTVVDEQVVVEAGDTMWGIAEEAYGDGQQYTQIWEATAGEAQPVGTTITDPNVILPGQILHVPTQVTAPAGEAVVPGVDESISAETAPVNAETPLVDDEAAQASPETPASAEEDVDAAAAAPVTDERASADASVTDVDEQHADWAPLWTAGGAGGILVGGLLAAIGIRRIRQRSRALPGQQTAQVAETVSPVEMALRYVDAPNTVEAIDRATRFIAADAQQRALPLPQLFAARIDTAGLTLFFATAAELPAPFTKDAQDGTAWLLPLDQVPDVASMTAAPYPALVTLGEDQHGGQLLVNLEYLGALHYDGDGQLARTAMMVLATELCTTAWGDAMQVTLVGFGQGLPHLLGTDRLRVVDGTESLLEQLRTVADAHAAAVAEAGLDSIAAARTADPESDAFAPEIVLLGEEPDEATRAQLSDILDRLPHVGLAVISSDKISGDWSLVIDSAESAVLQPLGLPIRPQMISDEEFEAVKAMLAATEEPAQPAPEWAQTMQEEPAPNVLVAEPTGTPEEIVEIPLPAHTGPYLSVFGAVRVDNAPGQTSGTATSISRWTEVIAILTLCGEMSATNLHEQLWNGEGDRAVYGTPEYKKRKELFSRVRRWITANHFPVPAPGAPLRVEGVRSQWDDWQWLVGDDISQASTSHLVTALGLIRGEPFSNPHDHMYGWAGVQGGLKSQMCDAIEGVAHEVAVRSWEANDVTHMRMAAAIGLLVSPLSQAFWRAAMRAEYLAGDAAGLERVIREFHLTLEAHDDPRDPLEADEQTLVLINTLRGGQLVNMPA